MKHESFHRPQHLGIALCLGKTYIIIVVSLQVILAIHWSPREPMDVEDVDHEIITWIFSVSLIS